MSQLTTAEFIQRVKTKHGDTFDCSLVEYRSYKKCVDLVCRKHGRFRVPAKTVLHSQTGGCEGCQRDLKSAIQTISNEEFIKRSRQVHGDYYIYDDVEYHGNKGKVIIICPKHGPFQMKACRHIQGRGCRECSHEKLRRDRRMPFWDFIDRVMVTHGARRYDYQLEGHVNQTSKIPIRCPIHGVFYQAIGNHVLGHGCSACAQSTGESRVRAVLVDTDVEFAEQVRFPACRAKRSLPFDFYVPGHRLLIEFDGTQHFENSERWGGDQKLAETQRYDEIKNQFAKQHGYTLLRIPYWKKGEIEDLVLEALAESEPCEALLKDNLADWRDEFDCVHTTLWQHLGAGNPNDN